MLRPRIYRFPDREALASAAADDLIECVQRATGEKGRCRIAVAGGSTPRPVYRLLAQPDRASRIDWAKVDVFWGDERCVPPTDPASNYRMVHEELLARVPIPEPQVHRMDGERSPVEAARAYERVLGEEPLDLVVLGLGTDGHTASLFPATPGLGTHRERVIATIAPVDPVHRISITLRTINEAGAVRFWASGPDKTAPLAAVFRQIERDDPRLPAAWVRPQSGRLCWLIDDAAGGSLGIESAEHQARPDEERHEGVDDGN